MGLSWAMEPLDHRGELRSGHEGPDDDGARVIVADVLASSARELSANRLWLGRWTDYSGRIITPSEHERKREELMARRLDQIDSNSRGPRT